MERKPRILFVDDETSVLNGLKRSFRDREVSWDMMFVNCPDEAIKVASALTFDVVVTDMKMPKVNGIDLIIDLRQKMPSSVYIVLTGAADMRCAIDSINRAGVYRFYTKPCPSFLLKDGICAAIDEHSKQENLPTNLVDPSLLFGEMALNQLSIAVLVVDLEGRVIFMNRRGGDLCAKNDGLCVGPDDICYTSTPFESRHLLNAIRDTATAGVRNAFSISRPSLKRSFFVVIAPLYSNLVAKYGRKVVGIYISDPEHNSVPPPEQLSVLMDLPPAKAKLAYCLAQGLSLEQSANDLNITTETARTYVKDIFSRTGTSRQSELIKLLLSHPGVDI